MMVWLIRVMVCSIVVFALPFPAFAQDTPTSSEWEVALYAGEEIIIVNAEGVSNSIELPNEARYWDNIGRSLQPMTLSADHQFLAFVGRDGASVDETGTPYLTLNIADLDAESCCTQIDNPLDGIPEYINIGGFSPDGSLLVASFHRPTLEPIGDMMVIVDVESGEITQTLDLDPAFGDANAVHFINWTDAGIAMLPICIPCNGLEVFSGNPQIWNPDDDELTTDEHHFFSLRGDTLAATGEFIQTANDTTYPPTQFGSYNVIDLRTGDDTPTTIYYNPELVILTPPHWVLDGNGFVMNLPNINALILTQRGESPQFVTLSDEMQFLAGTLDGWLMQGRDGALIHYTLDGDDVVTEQIGTFSGNLLTLESPTLGGTAEGEFVPAIEG